MKNMQMQVANNVLTITVDLTKEYGQSKSGKTTIVASSEGNQQVPDSGGIIIGLNIYKK